MFILKIISISMFLLVQVQCYDTKRMLFFEKEHLLRNIQSSTSEGVQTKTVTNLINRLLPNNTNNFKVFVKFNLKQSSNDADVFHIKKSYTKNVVYIRGSSGVAVAMGLHYYLKYYCKSLVSWQTIQLNELNVLPNIDKRVEIIDNFRYYQNTCTTSYSFVWWNWPEWIKHIDWMALNGINLPLALNAQEAIWDRVYRKYFNLTTLEINDQFTGPAFLAWNRMSNIRGWAGPLTSAWHNRSINLQKKILKRMRNFGMYPVLPGFAGTVPKAFKKKYPKAEIVSAVRWMQFGNKYCCPDVIQPLDPLFQTVGKLYMKELIAVFGTNHIYSADPFNEITPTNDSDTYLNEFARSILKVMTSVDEKSVWLLQNWFIVNSAFWTTNRVQAFLLSIPPRNLLILDLMSEQSPQYNRLNNYYGHFYIWCMLHNFGGNLGMFGSLPTINEELFNARDHVNSTMLGTGLTMEGINQNYVVYDFMTEMCWRNESVDLNKWYLDYSVRRYGKSNMHAKVAWHILQTTVYTWKYGQNHGEYIINQRPKTNYKVWYWYDIEIFLKAWSELLEASSELSTSESYLYDLVDVTRQALQIYGQQYYVQLVKRFKTKDIVKFQKTAKMFLDVFEDMDKVLKTSQYFLLGNWLESAKNIAKRLETNDKAIYEFNARNQITLWGPKGEIVDYASKQWSGIVSDYFAKRWQYFITAMNNSLLNNTKFNSTVVRREIFRNVEIPFTKSRKNYPTEPKGSTIQIVKEVFEKWTKHKNILHYFEIF